MRARPNLPGELGRNIPVAIQLAGARAFERYVDFFVATIRNANTRAAYWRAVQRFFTWCDERQLVELGRIRPVHVSAYIEQMNAAPPRKSSTWRRIVAVWTGWSPEGYWTSIRPAR